MKTIKISKSACTYSAELFAGYDSLSLVFHFYDKDGNSVDVMQVIEISEDDYDRVDRGITQTCAWSDRFDVELEEQECDGEYRHGVVNG